MPIRLFSIFLLLSMLAPAGSLGSVLYQCRMDGQVRQACCCRDAGSQQTPLVAFGGQEGCCDLKAAEDQPTPATHERTLLTIDAPQVACLPPSVTHSRLSELPRSNPPEDVLVHKPRGAPPVYLRTCSFLI
ncbi:hypothetical protein DBW_0275 [Desulfuromonas sp. DDH964]|uniref:hypothetical protein n=1 Tax=Desulfuromonas sp. DDH964 TaxID=1823759 RepID=UPI00078EA0A5|nr:hypothetical protein [Desulfuromonas sp. DDH964]AMV70675.1 hypothetical protein DBW_0275 [Desulfuromonas sp. DDH964]